MNAEVLRVDSHMGKLEKIGKKAISDDSAEVIYSIALNFWRSQQFERAEGVYSFLLTMRPRNPKYLSAAARCCYDMGDYRRALSLYGYAGTCGADPAVSILRVGQCYVMLGDFEIARAMFSYLVHGSRIEPSFADDEIIEQAEALLSILHSRIATD